MSKTLKIKEAEFVENAKEILIIGDNRDIKLPKDHNCDVMGCNSVFCIAYRIKK